MSEADKVRVVSVGDRRSFERLVNSVMRAMDEAAIGSTPDQQSAFVQALLAEWTAERWTLTRQT